MYSVSVIGGIANSATSFPADIAHCTLQARLVCRKASGFEFRLHNSKWSYCI